MAYKKTKEKMSREEMENRLEWMQVENDRLHRELLKYKAQIKEIQEKYDRLPDWIRRHAEKTYHRRCEK